LFCPLGIIYKFYIIPLYDSTIRLYNNTNNPWLDKMSTVDWSITRAYKTQASDLLLCNVMRVFTWLCISNSDDLKALFIPNREGRVKLFLRNEKSSQKYRKNNNAANYIEIFNIPTILVIMCMFHSVSDPRYLQVWDCISCFMLSYTWLTL
jgi:hypothetical protein